MMIDIVQALDWLNWQRRSEIPDMTRFWINRIKEPGLVDEEKRAIIENLVRANRKTKRASEQAEILANCSAYGYQLNMVDEAMQWLQDAERLYENMRDDHRQAVMNWMRFTVLRASGRYQGAFDCARRARRLFAELADQCRNREQAAAESWYSGRILDMTCDLISSPEDMFEWMYEFHGTLLSPSSAQIKDQLAQYLERRSFERADESMQLLLGISLKASDPQETGEALAYCGVINWVLENRTEAVQFFQSAMTQFIPGSHEHALLRWMLGLALFATPSERYNAISHMEASIDNFDNLRQDAIHKNRIDVRDWYAIHQIAMKRVLRTKISAVI